MFDLSMTYTNQLLVEPPTFCPDSTFAYSCDPHRYGSDCRLCRVFCRQFVVPPLQALVVAFGESLLDGFTHATQGNQGK